MKNPKDFLLGEAEKLVKSGKFEDALKNLDEIKNMYEHQDKDFWFNKGQHFLKMKEYSNATDCFEKDLNLNKKSYRSFCAKGIAQYMNESYHEAIESFNNAWEIKYAEILKNADQAKSLQNVKKFEKAIEYYDNANLSDAIDSQFWYYKALSLFQIGHYEDSIKCFDELLQNEPPTTEILYNKAKCEMQMGNIDSCISLLEKSFQLDPIKKEFLKKDPFFDGMNREKLENLLK